MDIYERFCMLLNAKGDTPYAVSKATGIPPSTFTDWKNGKSAPKAAKLSKIADYFGVSLSYLMGEDESNELDKQLTGIDFALWGEVKNLSESEKRDIYDYIMFKKSKRK